MSISTSFYRPPTQRRLLFGEAAKPADHTQQNGIWVTTERFPAKMGGLGEVSKTIPEAVATYLPKKDMRIIVPYQLRHREHDADPKVAAKDKFRSTGVNIPLKLKDGSTVDVSVLEKFEPSAGYEDKPRAEQRGNWVYALRNDNLFIAKNAKGEITNKSFLDYTYNPNAGEFDKVGLFNEAAARFIPLLDGNNADPNTKKINHFGSPESVEPKNKNIDFVLVHDWLTGPVLNELPDSDKTKKIFMVHNLYDKIQIPKVARELGLLTPQRLNNQEKNFSSLQMGIDPADSIIVNNNFFNTLTKTDLAKGAQFVDSLKKKQAAQNGDRTKRIFNMHHGLSRNFTAYKLDDSPNSFLLANHETEKEITEQHKNGPYQFVTLARDNEKTYPSRKQMEKFKAENKKALQKKLGLNVDDKAIIFSWGARLEPGQKGCYLLKKAVEDTLKNDKDKKIQFVIQGNTDDNIMKDWIEKLNTTPEYKGRVYIPNKFVGEREMMQANAGSDFTVLPSTYEPYGLTQLEAMRMGCIPVVHGVDGLKSSVYDPSFDTLYDSETDDAKKNGKQTGILMEPLSDISKYVKYTYKHQAYNGIKGRIDKLANLPAQFEQLSKKDPKKLKDNEKDLLKKGLDTAKKEEYQALVGSLKEEVNKRNNGWELLNAELVENNILPSDPSYQKLKTQQAQLRAEQKEIQAIYDKLNVQDHVDQESAEKIDKLLKPKPEEGQPDLNDTEGKKLTEAIDRAIQLARSPEKAYEVRLNGLEYLDKYHNWERIVKDNYKPVFEDTKIDEEVRKIHTKDWNEAHAVEKTENKSYHQYRPSVSQNAGKQSSESVSDWLNSMVQQFFIMNRRFWYYVGRMFAMRKD